jgi:hypothetical protein
VDCFDGRVDVCEAMRAATGFQEVVLEALNSRESLIRKDRGDTIAGRGPAFDVRTKCLSNTDIRKECVLDKENGGTGEAIGQTLWEDGKQDF